MHDCCIRVSALLECFEWTWNKPQNRTGGVASALWSTFGAISLYSLL